MNRNYFHPERREYGNRQWFTIRNQADGAAAEVYIYDEIGRGWFSDGVTPENLINEVKALKLEKGDTLRVRINSPGGDVFDGNTIYNWLRTLGNPIEVVIDGVAASAASIIAMAGDTRIMPENAFLFIHNPWMMAMGDSLVMRKAADKLDTIRESLMSAYLSRSNLDRDQLRDMLDEETWVNATDALSYGFATKVDAPVKAAALAQFDLKSVFNKIPDALIKAREESQSAQAKRREHIQNLKRAGGLVLPARA